MAETVPMLRQWLLLKALSSRRQGITLREMAAETGCSLKTIRRDLNTLQRVGFPLAQIESDHGRKHWRLDAAHLDSPPGEAALTFNITEALSLYLGRQFLEPLAGTHFWDGAQSAFRKIRACLGETALRFLDQFAAGFLQTTIGVRDYARHAEIIDTLMIGIEDGRSVRVTYHSLQSAEPATYTLQPYGLVWHKSALYLIARAPHHGEVRHYRVDRVTAADLTNRRFERPADFDLREHFRAAFGVYRGDGRLQRIRVQFLPAVARYVQEARWHPSQRLTPQRDGSLVAEFELDETEEIKRWILSFGVNAVVEGPTGLVEEMRGEVEGMRAGYERE